MTQLSRKNLIRIAVLPLALAAGLPASGQVTDPITTEATELLNESGLLARQSRLGEGILILDRQLQHAEAIERLIEVLGPDATIEVAPGEFLRFSDTPAGLRAQIEMVRLRKELEGLNAPAAPAPDSRPARSDGSELMEIIDRRLSELSAADGAEDEDASPEGEARLISVREIFGTTGDLSAVLRYGPDRVRVREGDSLIGGVRILSIGPDGVRVSRRGQELFLQLPN